MEDLSLSRLIRQTRSLREKSETQLLMPSNKLLEPKQRFQGKGEQVQKVPQSIIGIRVMME